MNFDVVVIGSGPGGYKAAISAARQGAKVCLVEKGLPGGTCLNHGCVPKKALVHLAGLLDEIAALSGNGLSGEIKGDFAAACRHKERVIEGIRRNFPVWIKRLGVNLCYGEARLLGPKQIQVRLESGALETLHGKQIILATGAEPHRHAVCATDGRRIIDSRDFMLYQRELPRSILCLGGGTIGSEFAFFLQRFGTQVCLVEQASRILNHPSIPERASAHLERKLKRIGVEIHKETTVTSLTPLEQGIRVQLADGGEGEFEQILVAIGRRPHTETLGLESTDVELDEQGFIRTNEYLETAQRGVYAIGDCKRGPMTANAALHDGKIAAANAVQGNHLRCNYRRVPMVVDSALEVAAIGLTEERADAAGFEPDVARSNFAGSPKALGRNTTEGFIEVVHDEETGQLLGGCIVGPEAGEQIHMLSAACESSRGLWFLKDICYSHPSWCEELGNTIDPYAHAFLQSGRHLFQPGINMERSL